MKTLSRGSIGRFARISVYAILILLLFVGTLARRWSFDHQRLTSAGDEQKLFLIGFDGATWKIIKPMMERGELPNYRSLVETGSSGTLESYDPMFSPQIWASIASGKLPEKHGIFDFLATTEDVMVKRIWDIFDERGKTVGILGYLNTYPPYPVNGFMIPSLMLPGSETYPEKYGFYRKLHLELSSLRGRQPGKRVRGQEGRISMRESIPSFLECIRHGVRLSTLSYMSGILLAGLEAKDNLTTYEIAGRIKFAKLRISSDIFSYITARQMPDLAIYYSKIPDNISHRYWKFFEPEKFPEVTEQEVDRLHDMIPESYRETDFALGKLLRNRTGNQTVLVCSDHGFKAVDTDIQCLKGYTLLNAMGLQDTARIWAVIGNSYLVIDDPESRELVVDRLRNITFGEKRLSFLEVRPDAARPGYYELLVHPQLQASPGEARIDLGGRPVPASRFLQETAQVISGAHAQDGILIVNGTGVKQNHELTEASVVDVTPTMLALYHYPIARDFDGKVLMDVFEDDYFAQAGLQYVDTYEKEAAPRTARRRGQKLMTEEMIERLKALGYLR